VAVAGSPAPTRGHRNVEANVDGWLTLAVALL
jgi:hypothetical protein